MMDDVAEPFPPYCVGSADTGLEIVLHLEKKPSPTKLISRKLCTKQLILCPQILITA